MVKFTCQKLFYSALFEFELKTNLWRMCSVPTDNLNTFISSFQIPVLGGTAVYNLVIAKYTPFL
jgi:hypothetical protein